MQVTGMNVYQRIHALSKTEFREMRAELMRRCNRPYYDIIAGNSEKVSDEERGALKRVYAKHGVMLDDNEIDSAIFMTMARSVSLRR